MGMDDVTRKQDRAPDFGADFRGKLLELFRWRRDVRKFKRDPLPPGTLERLLSVASLAPSVGLSEPWRFVIVATEGNRQSIRACFDSSNQEALRGYAGERAALYARLKLEGLSEAPCQLAVFADPKTPQGHGLGRMTMPMTIEYSAVAAVNLIWLAARAEGIGMGWVSILDPNEVKSVLDVPSEWSFIGYFCVGYPQNDSDTPTLETDGWESRAPVTILKR
ncbi:nitroreductase [Rhodoplanes sp. Z2-YC6860]|nr:nitroreductase [Rhodoplanes sp. Z2-YC6860]